MKTVRSGFAQKLVGDGKVLPAPAVLDIELLETLRAGQRGLEAVDATAEVVLRLVKHLLRLQDLEDLVAALELVLAMNELGHLPAVEFGLCALCLEQLSALRTGRLEGLDPVGLLDTLRWGHCACVCPPRACLCGKGKVFRTLET